MIELPEALTLARQLTGALSGKTVITVLPPSKPHKFCWFSEDPILYADRLTGAAFINAEGFGSYAELVFDNGKRLCINDGVNLRFCQSVRPDTDYQLLIEFTDGSSLIFTVAMYGGICLHSDNYDNEYYLKNRAYTSPFLPEFKDVFRQVKADAPKNLSVKGLIATEQRFPGLGNGVLQDILFTAGFNPRHKAALLTEEETDILRESVIAVLREMTDKGGRDTEKDIYGNKGGYRTMMSKNTLSAGCPVCGGQITKEAYMGGSVYYCPVCQK